MLNTIYHELGHIVVGRRQGFPLTAFKIENAGHGIFHGECGISYKPDTPYPLVLLNYFAGPLAEVRFLGNGAVIDFDRSFIPFTVANQKMSTPTRFVGAALVNVGREVFSDDWDGVNATIQAVKDHGEEVIYLEMFLQTLKAAIQFVNDEGNWAIITEAAQALAVEDALVNSAAGQTVDLLARATELLANVPGAEKWSGADLGAEPTPKPAPDGVQ